MLNISVPSSSEAAASYYAHEGLKHEGGFIDRARGALADLLPESITPAILRGLIRNRLPSGDKLTPRDREDRRSLHDFCFSPPKSVAIAHQVGGDTRIPWAVLDAVDHAMGGVQRDIVVRPKGKPARSGKGLWVNLYHLLSRPVDGKHDPGDHVHALLLNVGEHNGRRLTTELGQVVADSEVHHWRFQSRLAQNMHALGYDIRTTKNGWELSGISDEVVRTFSRRSEVIEDYAKAKNIRAPKAKAALAAKIREPKRAYDADRELDEWLKRLTPAKRKSVLSTTERALAMEGRSLADIPSPLDSVMDALTMRDSVVPEKRVLVECWRKEPLAEEPDVSGLVRREIGGVGYVSTPEAVRKERELVDLARRGTVTLKRTRKGQERLEAERQAERAGATLVSAVGLREWLSCNSEPSNSRKSPVSEIVHVTDADTARFADVHALARKADAEGFRVTLHGGLRDYRKAERGRPMVVLEELAKLPTGQKRPTRPVSIVVTEMAKRVIETLKQEVLLGGRTREVWVGRERDKSQGIAR